jgi:hypothetical protein
MAAERPGEGERVAAMAVVGPVAAKAEEGLAAQAAAGTAAAVAGKRPACPTRRSPGPGTRS